MVRDVPPFPGVKASLQHLQDKADLIVCSATPTPALQAEWSEHGIAQYVGAICGQEVGSKAEILAAAQKLGYESHNILMIGDAPGDMKAAKAVGALFYPINPGHEEASWSQFLEVALDRFLVGTYAGVFEADLIQEFDKYLPELPPWKQV